MGPVRAKIFAFLNYRAFDPELIDAMGKAYVSASQVLHDKNQFTRVIQIAEESVATRIIEIAETGERDPDKICKRVLVALGFPAEAAEHRAARRAVR